jgi:hypothetical protein
MKRLESMEDDMRGVATYELRNGMRATLEAASVKRYGAAEILRRMVHGDLLPTERVPVMQYGRRVGTLPPDFDPTNVKSRSFLYDYRRNDLVFEDGAWVANRTLGARDLDCVVGFERDSPDITTGTKT